MGQWAERVKGARGPDTKQPTLRGGKNIPVCQRITTDTPGPLAHSATAKPVPARVCIRHKRCVR